MSRKLQISVRCNGELYKFSNKENWRKFCTEVAINHNLAIDHNNIAEKLEFIFQPLLKQYAKHVEEVNCIELTEHDKQFFCDQALET